MSTVVLTTSNNVTLIDETSTPNVIISPVGMPGPPGPPGFSAIHVGTTPPPNPDINDVWIDTN